MHIPSLGTMSVLVGLYLVLTRAWAWARPAAAERWLRGFPRNRRVAPFLAAVVIAWAAWWVRKAAGESESFRGWQGPVLAAAPVVWWLVWKFMDSFLNARAYGALLLLVARPVLMSAFPYESPLRLLVVVYAYGMVLGGIAFGFSPHWLRDLIDWELASRARFRALCAGGLALGVVMLAAGLFVYPRIS